MIGMQDVIVYVPSINSEHLPRHALIAFISARTMLQEALASLPDCHLVGIGSISAHLHLAFDMNAERISGLLAQAMLALSIATAVRIVHNPSGLGLATRGLPSPLANCCH